MKARKRIALMLAGVLLAAMLPGTARAETLTVTAGRLNIRAEASAESKAIDVAKEGDRLEFIAKSGDWRKVRYNGKTGYVLKDYVVSGGDSAGVTDFSAEGRTNARVNLRAKPDVESDVVKVIGLDCAVKITGKSGKWYRVSESGKTGYLMAQYVDLKGGSPAEEKNEGGKTGTALASVNVRKDPSTESDVVRTVDEGEKVTVTGESGGWHSVISNGKKGYIMVGLLRVEEEKEDASSGGSEAGGTVTARVNLRSAADTGSKVLAVLDEGEKAQVLGRSGSFYQALYDGKIGYITRDCVKADSVPDGDTYPAAEDGVTSTSVNLRATPGGKIIRALPEGTDVLLLGKSGDWYRVSHKGDVGYVSEEYVTGRKTGGEQQNGASGSGETVYVTASSLNLRKGPGEDSAIVRVLGFGEEIRRFEEKDGWYRVKAGSDEGYVAGKYVADEKPEPGQNIGKVILSDWFRGEVSDAFDRGDTATITDVRTGISFKAKRTGGYSHADAQPLTEADTKIMHKIYGYRWQWTRRPVWVTVNGRTYAGSMNGMPHGETDPMPDNDFDGCFCIHFLNSRTHGTDRVDDAHQKCVQEAGRGA